MVQLHGLHLPLVSETPSPQPHSSMVGSREQIEFGKQIVIMDPILIYNKLIPNKDESCSSPGL